MPKILDIITHPNKNLRQACTEIDLKTINDPSFKSFLSNMLETMLKKDGIGLAAPQVGKNIRLAVIKTKDGPLFLINPIITKKSLLKETAEEGCLSVPGVFGDVKRPKNITCSFVSQEGKLIDLRVTGFMARVFQHEIDHLDGILFIDKAKNLKHVE